MKNWHVDADIQRIPMTLFPFFEGHQGVRVSASSSVSLQCILRVSFLRFPDFEGSIHRPSWGAFRSTCGSLGSYQDDYTPAHTPKMEVANISSDSLRHTSPQPPVVHFLRFRSISFRSDENLQSLTETLRSSDSLDGNHFGRHSMSKVCSPLEAPSVSAPKSHSG